MERIVVDLQSGVVQTVQFTPQEEASALAQKAAWDAENTLDKRAARAIDGADRLQFEHLFDLENRMRVLEGRAVVTRLQYRDALIARWKALNP